MNRSNKFLTTPMAVLFGSVVIAIAILISGGVIKIGSKAAQPGVAGVTASAQPTVQPTISLNQIKDIFNKSQIKFGDTNKKLIVIEVSDPSCPYCQIAAGKNPELNKEAGARFTLVTDGGSYVAPVPEIQKLVSEGKAAFAWLYFPGHSNGEMGTKAMYCAFEKGKFWEVHDLIMSNAGYNLLNNQIKNDKAQSGELANFLQSVIDSQVMKQCLDSGKYDSRLQTDMSLAQGLGLSGTPGFYLNATPFAGAYSYKDMEAVVKTTLGF